MAMKNCPFLVHKIGALTAPFGGVGLQNLALTALRFVPVLE
jgi:hypothetical protein